MATICEERLAPRILAELAFSMLTVLATALSAGDGPGQEVELEIRSGVTDAGHATEEWRGILRRRLRSDQYAAVAGVRKPLTEDENQWRTLIRSRLPAWSLALAALGAAYDPAPPPPHVAIILGNRGGSDAFTHDPTTIGFDLSALQSAYGAASSSENIDRIDRLFHHEYAHLMQKSWMRSHAYRADTPYREALLSIWLEGLGNYHSMSKPWRASEGVLSPKAADALAILEPRFCARLSGLACSTREGAERLTADLSEGRFDRKWGGLTLALWLEEEMSVSRDAYRQLVLAGPNGIPVMARRHLPPLLAAVIEESVIAAELCAAR
jgi:hypothetical protein